MSETAGSEERIESTIRRAQAGDEAAFEELVRRYYERIYRWSLIRTGDPDEAEDVVQTVLVKLYRKLDSFDFRSQFSTWLYQVVVNAAHGTLRSRMRRVRLVERASAAGAMQEEVVHPAVEESVRGDRTVELIATLMEELPERQRQAFDLVDLQGYEPVEVSRMLGLRPVTVRTHLLRARRVIRTRVLESYPELVEG